MHYVFEDTRQGLSRQEAQTGSFNDPILVPAVNCHVAVVNEPGTSDDVLEGNHIKNPGVHSRTGATCDSAMVANSKPSPDGNFGVASEDQSLGLRDNIPLVERRDCMYDLTNRSRPSPGAQVRSISCRVPGSTSGSALSSLQNIDWLNYQSIIILKGLRDNTTIDEVYSYLFENGCTWSR